MPRSQCRVQAVECRTPEDLTMLSGKKVKLLLLEVVQFTALAVPVFVVLQRFGVLVSRVSQPPAGGSAAYWLIVACAVAYVTSVALLVWLPVKVVLFRRSGLLSERGGGGWRPAMLAYLILSMLPCFCFLVAASQLQVSHSERYDSFAELPVSLVLLSLVCVDVVERIRPCRLTGHGNNNVANMFDHQMYVSDPTLTHVMEVNTVSSHLDMRADDRSIGSRIAGNGSLMSPSFMPSLPSDYGSLSHLCASDPRAELPLQAFMFWLDTVELLRVAMIPSIYLSSWVFPIYLFTYLSTLRLVANPRGRWLPLLGVCLQDIPFFFLRIALISSFGFVTPLLYVAKNLLVILSFFYFNYMTRLKFLNTEHMF